MKRINFFKSLIGLIVAPSVIAKIDWEQKRNSFKYKPIYSQSQDMPNGNTIAYGEIKRFKSTERMLRVYQYANNKQS